MASQELKNFCQNFNIMTNVEWIVKQDLACYYQLLHEKSKAGKRLKRDDFLKNSPLADAPIVHSQR
jgi:hypothetical protein